MPFAVWVLYARPPGVLLPDRPARAMAKKKRKGKKKTPNEAEATAVGVVVAEKAAGLSATAHATFARDLAAFGSRPNRHARDSGR